MAPKSPYPLFSGSWLSLSQSSRPDIRKGWANVNPIRHKRGNTAERSGRQSALQMEIGTSKRLCGLLRCCHAFLALMLRLVDCRFLSNRFRSSNVSTDLNPERNIRLTHHINERLKMPLVDSGGRLRYSSCRYRRFSVLSSKRKMPFRSILVVTVIAIGSFLF